MIQVSERARQGRLRARFMKEIRQDEERQRRAKDRNKESTALDEAAVCIQKASQICTKPSEHWCFTAYFNADTKLSEQFLADAKTNNELTELEVMLMLY